MYTPDPKVYEAARAFAMQSSEEIIRDILLKSIDFEEEDIDELMSMVEFHKNDIDGGYSAFIKAVNQLLGNEIYCIECDYKKIKKGETCSL